MKSFTFIAEIKTEDLKRSYFLSFFFSNYQIIKEFAFIILQKNISDEIFELSMERIFEFAEKLAPDIGRRNLKSPSDGQKCIHIYI